LLKEPHLISAIDNIWSSFTVVSGQVGRIDEPWHLLLLLVHNLDGGNVIVINGVSFKIYMVLDEEVHKSILLLWRQFTKDKGLNVCIGLVQGLSAPGVILPSISLSHFHSFRNKL
jgi:hypothetical protein